MLETITDITKTLFLRNDFKPYFRNQNLLTDIKSHYPCDETFCYNTTAFLIQKYIIIFSRL